MKTIFCKIGFIFLIFGMGLMSCSKKDYPPVEGDTLSSNSISTLAPGNVTTTTAYLQGSVNNIPPGSVIESGIILKELAVDLIKDPTAISGIDSKKYPGVMEGDKNFFVALSDLKANTRYAYTGYVTTPAGTTYGRMKILVTSYSTVNDVDGNIYQTIKIGTQVWMRENLKTTFYSDNTMVENLFNLGSDNIFGKHYTWQAASRQAVSGTKSSGDEGVCPTGWHLPSDAEWQTLLEYLGGSDQASLLKDASPGYWDDSGIVNCTGFSLLPAGVCTNNSGIACYQAAYWTSTPFIFYGFENNSDKIIRGDNPPGCCGFSVRCVKD